ncbi:MAG: tetratricopeptide repeat protein [Deltaproteobacteria bacterium]|nr:tetratricopeptide repeat protein [Deltaproteobacteria bacterium]
MKKSTLNFLLICAFSPLLLQCAAQSDVDDLRYQLRIVNKKIEDLKSTTVGQLQKRQAASSGQVDQLGTEMLELKSQLEETIHLNNRLKEQNKELEQNITTIARNEAEKREELVQRFEAGQLNKEQELRQLDEKIRLQNENLQAIQDARIKDAERRAQKAARAAKEANAKAARASSAAGIAGSGAKHIRSGKKKITFKVSEVVPTSPRKPAKAVVKHEKPVSTANIAQPATAVVKQSTPPADDLASARKLFDKNKLDSAYTAFETIATSTSKDAVRARFMMGECLFKQKEYDKAIMQYQKIISQHSKDSLAPAAMLRQGISFEKLSDKQTAKVIYKKILKQHGSSPEAGTAKEKLDKL